MPKHEMTAAGATEASLRSTRGSWRPKMCQALSLLWKLKQRKSQCQTVAIWVSKLLVWVEDSRNSEKFLVWDIQMCIITLFWWYWWVFIFFLRSLFWHKSMLIVSHSPTRVSFKWPKIGCMKDRRLAAFFMEVSDSTNDESWPQMIPNQQNPTPCYHVWLWK